MGQREARMDDQQRHEGSKDRKMTVRRADLFAVPVPEVAGGLGSELVLGDANDAGGALVNLDVAPGIHIGLGCTRVDLDARR